MKQILIIPSIFLILSCQSYSVSERPLIAADTLAIQINQYAGKEITLEGKIIHVCPVDGSKMKLSGNKHQIIKIIPSSPKEKFESHWNGKQVRIQGKVQEIRLSRTHIDSLYKAGSLLCHIDFSPCSDTAWAAAKHRQGKTEEIVRNSRDFLENEMQKTGKNYVSVIILQAIQIKEIKVITETVVTSRNSPGSFSVCSWCPLCGHCLLRKKVG